MRVLCVAEKPSIAKSISQILSGGQFATHPTRNQYIKNYEFNYHQTNSFYTVTCVSGHLTSCDFDDAHRKWNSCDAFELFDAPIETTVDSDKKAIEENLMIQASRADTLMIWTDCDREGEHIGLEIVRVCRKSKRNIQVRRARFSAIIAQQIHQAAQNPVELDRAQAAAVEARIVLDLRIGAAFTRMQTLILQDRFAPIRDAKNVVSYGPCQFPTLGFVVHKWNLVKSFVSESFWYIYLSLTPHGEDEATVFTWKRNRVFGEVDAIAVYEFVMLDPIARVTKVIKRGTKKWKPLPLTTVELQKAGSRLLKLAPKKVLDIAERLYQQGFLSYPRTETDQFDPAFDFKTLIQKQTVDPAWGEFATSLNGGGFSTPREGKNNDKAHPPIHPTAHAGNLAGDDKKVYDFITRRFLAACSKDAEGFQTTVDVICGGESFSATGLVVLEKNYLLVYPYDKWVDHELPDFEEGEEFQPTICELRNGQTTKPSLLTEADLVTLMDKNGIGTDATIAQHIQTIIDRDYVIEKMEGATKYLIPSKLGIGLIEGYNQIGLSKSLSKPQLRRETERSMVRVCEGTKSKSDMLEEAIDQYKEMYIIAKREFNKVITSVRRYLEGNDDGGNAGQAGGGGGDGPGGGPGGSGGRPARSRGAEAPRSRGNARGVGRGGRGGRRTRAQHSDDDDFDEPPPRRRVPASTNAPSAEPRSSTSAKPISRQPVSKPVSRQPTAPSNANSGEITCNCNVPAIQRTVVKESVSKGRKFWTCSTNSDCGFFQWVEDDRDGLPVVPTKRSYSARHNSETAERQCKCNLAAGQRTVTKEGANQGRIFWVCPKPQVSQCGFFEWDDQPPSLENSKSAARVGGGNSGPTTGECFKCNQEGHWANTCPNDNSAKRPRSFGTSSYPDSSAANCFKCQQPGHFSSSCPNGEKAASASTRGGGSSDTACFKCGDTGHWSNACPGESNQRSSSSTRGTSRRGRGRGTSSSTPARGKRGRGRKKSSFGAPDGP